MKAKTCILLVCLSVAAVTHAQKIVLSAETCVWFWSREIGTFNSSDVPFEKDTVSSLIFDDENKTITVDGVTYFDPMSEDEIFEQYGIMVLCGSGLNVVSEKYLTFYSMSKYLYAISSDAQVVIELLIRVGDFDGATSIIIRKLPYNRTDHACLHYNKSLKTFYYKYDDDGNLVETDEKYPIYIEEHHAKEYMVRQ